MTGKELKAIRQSIPRFKNGERNPDLTPENWKTHKELDCIEMINSCLIYGSDPFHKKWDGTTYMDRYVEALGMDRVLELIEMQRKEIAQAEIGFAGYDNEGVGYNYCKWRDEL